MRLKILLTAIPLLFTACGPLFTFSQSTDSYFVIDELEANHQTVESSLNQVDLLVREMQANRFLNSTKIVFSEGDSRRGHYQMAHWVQPPARRLSSLLFNRLEDSRSLRSVSKLGNSTLGNYQLNTELRDFHHDTKKRPGHAVVELRAELVDLRQHRVLAHRRFARSIPAEKFNAEGAVAALTLATNQLLDEIIEWTVQSLAQIQTDGNGDSND